jgi:heptosyltransferase-3
MSILFITSSRIGDAILSTGALEFACKILPDSPVVVAGGPLVTPLFEDWPGLERVIEIHRKPLSSHWVKLWAQTVKRPWKWVVDVRGSTLSYFLKAEKRLMWRSVASPKHRVEQISEIFKFPRTHSPTLYASAARQKKIKDILPPGERPIIVVAPIANWRGKEWPQEKFKELLQRLTSKKGLFEGAQIAFFAAPNERERITPLLQSFPEENILDMVGKLSLLDIFVFFQKSIFFIGNDSGLMHLAAASGVPTIGLFGPSPEVHYAPYGPYASYVRTPESYAELMGKYRKTKEVTLMNSLSVEKVQEEIHNLWQRTKKSAFK